MLGRQWVGAGGVLLAGFLHGCSAPVTAPAPQPAPMPTPVRVGAEVDAHGCRPSAGYVWSAQAQQCVRPWEHAVPVPVPPSPPASR